PVPGGPLRRAGGRAAGAPRRPGRGDCADARRPPAPPVIAVVAATVVLGSSAFAPNGNGFGTAHPSHFHNGGDPNGGVNTIHGAGWGRAVAHGRGLNPIFEPQGGYFPREARVRLRAQRLGSCGAGPAYTELFIRAPQWPGGPLGPWWRWSLART